LIKELHTQKTYQRIVRLDLVNNILYPTCARSWMDTIANYDVLWLA